MPDFIGDAFRGRDREREDVPFSFAKPPNEGENNFFSGDSGFFEDKLPAPAFENADSRAAFQGFGEADRRFQAGDRFGGGQDFSINEQFDPSRERPDDFGGSDFSPENVGPIIEAFMQFLQQRRGF